MHCAPVNYSCNLRTALAHIQHLAAAASVTTQGPEAAARTSCVVLLTAAWNARSSLFALACLVVSAALAFVSLTPFSLQGIP